MLLGIPIVFSAMLLAGITGFGYALVSVPLLLLVGMPLPQVVVINLAIAIITRIVIAFRTCRYINVTRVIRMVAGSIPGIAIGLLVLDHVDTGVLRVGVGFMTVAAAAYLAFRRGADATSRGWSTGELAVGGAGGFLGVTASLNGVPAALLLSYHNAKARTFIADIATYILAVNSITLVALFGVRHGNLNLTELAHYFSFWAPAGIAGSILGVRLASLLPQNLFRRLTLLVIAASGCTIVGGVVL